MSYTSKKILLITKKVELIEKKQLTIAILDLNHKIFVVYIATLNINFDISDKVYALQKAQIAYPNINKALIKAFIIYANFIDILL